MVIVQNRSKRKPTGGRYKKLYRAKRNFETGLAPMHTTLNERKSMKKRTLGADSKEKLLSCNKANVYDPVSKKYKVVTIKNIVDNPANRHFVRQNVMTKGAIIETEVGKARITSRPGQNGSVNAVLV